MSDQSTQSHPLLSVLRDAAARHFPQLYGSVLFVPPLGPGLEAVVSMTGRAYLATSLSPGDLTAFP